MRMRTLSSALLFNCLLMLLPLTALAKGGIEDQAARITQLLGAGPTSVIADIGAGDGEFALASARRLGPTSVVYATEIEQDKLDAITDAAAEAALQNVRVVQAGVTATGLPGGCCDGIFLRAVYHHVTEPEPFLASVYDALQPGGKLVIIDFRPTIWLWLWRPKGVPENRNGHGIPPEVIEAELLAAGFERVEFIEKWTDDWPQRYFAWVFRKPEAR